MGMFNGSISARLALSIANLLIVTLIVIGSALYLSKSLETAASSNAASYRVLDSVDRAYGAVIDLANRSRAFVLSDRDERRIKGYNDAKAFYAASMDAARSEIKGLAGSEAIAKALDAMDVASTSWQHEVGEQIISLGRNAATAKDAIAVAGSSKAADVMQNYRDVVAHAREDIVKWSRSAQDTQDAQMRALITGQTGGAFVLVCLSCFIGWRLSRHIVVPVTDMTATMRDLASGHLEVEILHVARTDEIGAMAKAIQFFKTAAVEQKLMRAAADRSREDLDQARAATEEQRVASDLKKIEDLKVMVERVEIETRAAVNLVVEQMSGMSSITSEMSQSARTLSGNSETVAAAAHQTQATMESALSATATLSKSISEIASRIQVTHKTTKVAADSSKTTEKTIAHLSEVVGEIDGVTKVITTIARQTNLLAINAGVEASRYGQNGKGFAVIAQEVKTLAEQTTSATNRISRLVEQVQSSTGAAVDAVTSIAETIQGVNVAAQDMAATFDQQVGITQQIVTSIQETVSANSEVASRMQSIAEEAQTSEVQASEVERVCDEVARQVRDLQLSLVRIVRTSSTEIERRRSERFEVVLSAVATWKSKRWTTSVHDVSLGGARISALIDLGQQIQLQIDGMRRPLQAIAVAHFEGQTGLRFDLDEAQKSEFDQALRSRLPGLTRAA